MTTSHRVTADQLLNQSRQIFEGAGTPAHIATVVAQILVGANLTGHDSHGVLRIPAYLKQIEAGSLNPAAEPEVLNETANTLQIDGGRGFGHYTAYRATKLAIDKAKAGSMCGVSLRNTTHIGRLGEYVEMTAQAGCIGLFTYGLGDVERGRVVPFGGARGALSTNPIAIGLPTGDEAPFVLDMATSVVAEGKLQVARSKGTDVPEGFIVDQEGKPTTKTADFYDGGYLLPFGGHKGYALSLFICLMGGLNGNFDLSAGRVGGEFLQVINVEAFTPLTGYQQHVRGFLDAVKAIPPAPGFAEVLVPGDFEHRTRTQRQIDGIDLPETIYQQLQGVSQDLNVPFNL